MTIEQIKDTADRAITEVVEDYELELFVAGLIKALSAVLAKHAKKPEEKK